MKIAIMSATPYQTLNAVKLAMGIIPKGIQKDLYYRNFNSTTNRVLNNLRKSNIFNNIYEYKLFSKKHLLKYMYNDLEQALSPLNFLKSVIVNDSKPDLLNYDYITVTSGTEFEIALYRINKKAKIIAYDDGIGSYVGNIIHDQYLNPIWHFLGRRPDKINPSMLYVNNPGACNSTLAPFIRPLSTENANNVELNNLIQGIFDYKPGTEYLNEKYVFLTQPINELKINESDAYSQSIEYLLKNKIKQTIIRFHPRDNDIGKFKEFTIDKHNDMWELLCQDQITNNHVLLGLCSSAQITPKLFYDKEPYIIFLYHMFNWGSNPDVFKRFAKIEDLSSNLYKCKGRIFAPQTFLEFTRVIEKINIENRRSYERPKVL